MRMELYGSYVLIYRNFASEHEKQETIMECVRELIASAAKSDVKMDWNTLRVIVKNLEDSAMNLVNVNPWEYVPEEPLNVKPWKDVPEELRGKYMTVGIKFMGGKYAEDKDGHPGKDGPDHPEGE